MTRLLSFRHRKTPDRHDGEPPNHTREQPAAREGSDGPGRTASGDREPNEGFGPDADVERDAPDTPSEMPKRSWWAVLRRTFREFQEDELTDRAASLTYYGVLSLFPALLVLVSLLGLAGKSVTNSILDNLTQLTPGSGRDVITSAVQQLQGNTDTGSVMAIAGLALALWSASGYVAAFIRTSNIIYDIPEGRPVWKVLPVRLGLTVALMVLAVASALIVVFTGGLAQQAGAAFGIGDAALATWSIAKWPVLVVLATIMIAILYWATPNARFRGFRWITPGSFLALLIWMIASAGFAFYVAAFASYNKTYGAFAGVIVFLLWLWISNLAILLGLEFDAELARERAIVGGHPAEAEPYVEARDTRKWNKRDKRRLREQR